MTVPARYPAGDQARRAMIAKVKIAQKELGLEDGDYRLILKDETGKTSAADCTAEQLGKVLDRFKARGWTPRVFVSRDDKQTPARAVGIGRAVASSPMAKKARALWISLYQLGAVRDPSDRALEAFGRRQLGVDRLQWADEGQGYRLIEALKAMAERAGWSQDVSGVPAAHQVVVLKLRLAQCLRIKGGFPGSIVTAETVDHAIATYAQLLGRGVGR